MILTNTQNLVEYKLNLYGVRISRHAQGEKPTPNANHFELGVLPGGQKLGVLTPNDYFAYA